MGEVKNTKRNANRPKAKDKGFVQSLQRNYKKRKVELDVKQGKFI